MNTDATVYSVYLQYMGRKASLLDTASAVKASTVMLQDDDILYTMVSLGKLYAYAGYLPIVTNIKEKEVELSNSSDSVILDIDHIKTAKDRSMALLTAVSYQPKYASAADRLRGVMDDLTVIYKDGKDFDTLLNRHLRGKYVSLDSLTQARTKILDFLQYFKGEVDTDDKNIIHLAFSEVLEDIEEIISKITED